MPDWYYKKDDRVIGPVSRQELDYLATERRIRASTEVRRGNAGEWTRFRPARNVEAVAAVSPEKESVAKAADLEVPRSGPPKLKQKRDVTKRQAMTGTILAVLLLLVLWFLWSRFAGGSPTGSTSASGQGLATSESVTGAGTGATDEGTQPVASTAARDGEAATDSAEGQDQAQEGDPLDNSGDGSVETTSTGDSNSENEQSTASVSPDDDPEKDDDLATESTDGMDSIQSGDPLSKFTISAPGEAVFFGLRATGNRFAFVVDRSGSMNGLPMKRARKELMSCINHMPKHVEVFVVFFDDLAYPDEGSYRGVDAQNLQELEDWVNTIQANGGTDVKIGMRTVFSEGKPPDAIFLLTDGNFAGDTPSYIRKLNSKSGVRINTVALVSRAGESLLKQIAAENDGDYRFVP